MPRLGCGQTRTGIVQREEFQQRAIGRKQPTPGPRVSLTADNRTAGLFGQFRVTRPVGGRGHLGQQIHVPQPRPHGKPPHLQQERVACRLLGQTQQSSRQALLLTDRPSQRPFPELGDLSRIETAPGRPQSPGFGLQQPRDQHLSLGPSERVGNLGDPDRVVGPGAVGVPSQQPREAGRQFRIVSLVLQLFRQEIDGRRHRARFHQPFGPQQRDP